MQILLDNLSSALIAAVLFLMMVGVNTRTQTTMTESTGFYAMMKQGENFIQVIRRDMQGVETPPADSGYAYTDTLGVARVNTFTYTGYVDTSTVLQTISYSAAVQDTMVVNGTNVPIFQVTRQVGGVAAGGSSDTFIEWKIRCLDESENPTTTPADCTQIDISFQATPKWGDLETVPRLNWSSTFRPPLLQN